MTRKIALLVLAAFTAFGADEALPKAETVLDRYIEVTGGKAAYQNRKTFSATGIVEFTAQGLKGTVTRYAAAPDRSYSALDLDGIGKMEEGSSGGVAWENSALLGPRVKSGEELAQALREGTFNGELNWRALYPKVENTGIEKLDGEDCYKLILTPKEGRPETAYYQKKSGLIVKMTTIASTQMGDVPLEVRMSEYKAFGGVMMPTRTTQKAIGQEFSITIQNVKVNDPVPAGRFDAPAEVKALLNK